MPAWRAAVQGRAVRAAFPAPAVVGHTDGEWLPVPAPWRCWGLQWEVSAFVIVLQEGGPSSWAGACPVLSRNLFLSRLNWNLLLGLSVRWAAGGGLVSEDKSLQETTCGWEVGWEALASVPWVLWAVPAIRTLLTCFQASGAAFGPVFLPSPRFTLASPRHPSPGGCVPVPGTP